MNLPVNKSIKPTLSAVEFLAPSELTVDIASDCYAFTTTAELLKNNQTVLQTQENPAWLLQAEAKQAAQFGLGIQQKGFNILALGESGTGRTTLMLNVMREMASQPKRLFTDLVAVYQFGANGVPLFLRLPAGEGLQLKKALDGFVREFGKALASLMDEKVTEVVLSPVKTLVATQLDNIKLAIPSLTKQPVLAEYFAALKADALDYLNAWQPSLTPEGDQHIEAMLNEAFMGRYRVNLLVSNAQQKNSPVVVDEDPSLQSLFGGIESAGDSSTSPEFLRLKAGHLLRADGGVLLVHLRDLLADEQNGLLILEKLHRFCRNGHLVIDDLSGGGQSIGVASAQVTIPSHVKLVLVTTREDYYDMLEEKQDFFSFFPIKVEFSENVKANQANYDAIALFVAQKCAALNSLHFTADAVTCLLQALHRLEEDKTRLSTQLAVLEKLIIESVAVATLNNSELVASEHVKAALARRYKRHSYIEGHIRESIVDQELLINVQGEMVGQINGLTHIDLADASFGSPVRISANCYAGARGVVTIDREVTMSGPTHDKGVMIMQSWLQHHFCQFNPLNFTASLVFEQEYNGVDGDSASCAELFALMSSLTQLPINQSIAVTGAMNQHGEVLPVGGINEKIEGYFRVCQDIGLTGKQGVLIPAKNVRHLMLSDEVIQAVQESQFHIATMSRVEEGLMYLMDTLMEEINEQAIKRLLTFKAIIESNRPIQKRES